MEPNPNPIPNPNPNPNPSPNPNPNPNQARLLIMEREAALAPLIAALATRATEEAAGGATPNPRP